MKQGLFDYEKYDKKEYFRATKKLLIFLGRSNDLLMIKDNQINELKNNNYKFLKKQSGENVQSSQEYQSEIEQIEWKYSI